MKKIFLLIAMLSISVGLTFAQSNNRPSGQTTQIELIHGGTSVELSSGFIGALTALNIAPGKVFPARIRNGIATFPITDGTLDRQTLRGEIAHNGGLTLTRGATKVKLKGFTIDTTGTGGIILTGLVSANGAVVGRIPLFDLTLPTSSSIFLDIERVDLDNVSVTLRPEAATALNAVFETNAFVAGFGIGTARVRGFGYGD
ncbi:MAG: HtaA domain-containing protein [Chloracidobacterium sp.]|nr:HtaA domain-containing protein [Chloracidobacterium sp.]